MSADTLKNEPRVTHNFKTSAYIHLLMKTDYEWVQMN